MDNTTPLSANDYDAEIEKIVPFYSEFHRQTIDLVKSFHWSEGSWLDTGCGTGTLVAKAMKEFPAFRFVLCDPSEAMIVQARKEIPDLRGLLEFHTCGTQNLEYKNEFDIITAIQSHHYLGHDDRSLALKKCFDALKVNGVFIFFENFAPSDERSKNIVMNRWGRYQQSHGKTDEEISQHQRRYDRDYFPITLERHFHLMFQAGFKTIEIFWLSYMQAGIYAIK